MKKIKTIIIIISSLFLVFIILINNKTDKKPEVTSTDPKNNEQEISERKQISINFNSISDNQKNKISYDINPKTENTFIWLNTTLKLVPTEKLTNNTTYTVNIIYDKKNIYSFSFKTQTFKQEEIDKYGALQSQNDYLFGQEYKKFIEKYPFYSYMPIRSRNYIVDFLPDTNTFKISILDKKTDQDIEKYKTEIKNELNKIGVKDPIKFTIQL